MTTPTATAVLYVARELGSEKSLLACTTQAVPKLRFRPVPARDLAKREEAFAKAQARFGRPADAPVRTGSEAGRDDFGLHRALTARGIDNVVVEASSIEVNRRNKHAQTDPMDAGKLVNRLCRYHGGEPKVGSVVNVLTVADEDRRQLHRGLKDLQRQPTECRNRIKGPLASAGLSAAVDAAFRTTRAALRAGAGAPVPAGLQQRILQE